MAQKKATEAEIIFKSVLDEKLPTARSLAWANVGLGEVALQTGRAQAAARFFSEAIRADAEYGATLAARRGRNKAAGPKAVDPGISGFFSKFDNAVKTNSKAEVDSLVVNGEISTFVNNVAAQAQFWSTKVYGVDQIDADNVSVETDLTIRLINRESEHGTAVFRLSKIAGQWKINSVEMFEVR